MRQDLLIRNVELNGVPGMDVRICGGRVAEIGPRLAPGGEELEGAGGALLPGLCDHHIHLFGLAAQKQSVALEDLAGVEALRLHLKQAAASRPRGGWIRATGYHERIAGDLTRERLDAWVPDHPLRVQHQTGALWVFNSAALAQLPAPGDDPAGLDRETGWLWRGDAWLKAVLGAEPPDFAPAGRELARLGVTSVTDASVTTDAAAASRLAHAHRSGDLPQRLTLMSGGPLMAPADGAFAVGPVKVLLDDHDLIDFDDFRGRIAQARAWRRKVAVHCVTAAELALTLAAFEAEGAGPGDRIEHGALIPQAAIAQIRALSLTVATQPAFVLERGERYLAEVEPDEQGDLYRCASLVAAGIPVLGSSDAPYASPDPWRGMGSAVVRRTMTGAPIVPDERISPAQALGLYLQAPAVEIGASADLCLLETPRAAAFDDLAAVRVRATLVGGRLIHLAP